MWLLEKKKINSEKIVHYDQNLSKIIKINTLIESSPNIFTLNGKLKTNIKIKKI